MTFMHISSLLALTCVCAGAWAKVEQVAYYTSRPGESAGDLVQWDNKRLTASLTGQTGISPGTYTDTGVLRVITLNTPLSSITYSADIDACLGQQAQIRQDIQQIAFRQTSGTPSRGTVDKLSLGTLTYLDGCRAGQSEPFGSLDDAGQALNALGMAKRPAMPVLSTNLKLAGFSETPSGDLAPDPNMVDADRTTVPVAGQMRFARSLTQVAAVVDADGWLKLSFPATATQAAFVRAYTKLATDATTGRQHWLEADFANGSPKWVRQVTVVPYKTSAAFTTDSAARTWLHSWVVPDWEWRLLPDGAGQVVAYDADPALPPLISPISAWSVTDGNVAIQRPIGSIYVRTRSWQPLNRVGAAQWMLEREIRRTNSTGQEVQIFGWRVVMWTDRGPAVPVPAARVKAGATPAAKLSLRLQRGQLRP